MKDVLLFLIGVLLVCGLSGQQSDAYGFYSRVGDQVELPTLQVIDGTTIAPDQMKGKVTLLAFFGTRCPPCLRELPRIKEEVVGKYDPDHFQMIAFGALDDALALVSFEERKKFGFTYVADRPWTIFRKFAKSKVPRKVLLDEDGKILYQSSGYNIEKFDKLVSEIEKALQSTKS